MEGICLYKQTTEKHPKAMMMRKRFFCDLWGLGEGRGATPRLL